MTTISKRIGGPAALTTSPVTVYTCPVSTVAVIRRIHVSNPSGSALTFTMSIGADAAGTRLYDGYSIAANSALDVRGPLTLEAGNIIQAFGSGTALVFEIDGTETTTVDDEMGPLVVSANNPRYFAKPDGSIVFLTGSHHHTSFEDSGTADPPPVHDYAAYLAHLVAHNQNFLRLWCGWNQTRYLDPDTAPALEYFSPGPPWKRTGPGNADDGKLKYDLTQFEQSFFDRVRARVLAAKALGIYVQVMFIDGYDALVSPNLTNGGAPWKGANNINGINLTDSLDWTRLANATVTGYQDALIHKYADTLYDCDNVLWEPSNESGGSNAWIDHVLQEFRSYEIAQGYSQKPRVYTTLAYPWNDSVPLGNTHCEAIAWGDGRYSESDGTKVVINDSDHSYGYVSLMGDGTTVFRTWPFKCLCLGTQAQFMDPWLLSITTAGPNRNNPGGTITNGVGTTLDTKWDPLRNALGDAALYAARINLKLCTPHTSLSTTGFCVANPGVQYIALQHESGAFDLTLVAGTYSYEWFDVVNRVVNGTGSFSAGSGARLFTPPFSGAALLLLQVQP